MSASPERADLARSLLKELDVKVDPKPEEEEVEIGLARSFQNLKEEVYERKLQEKVKCNLKKKKERRKKKDCDDGPSQVKNDELSVTELSIQAASDDDDPIEKDSAFEECAGDDLGYKEFLRRGDMEPLCLELVMAIRSSTMHSFSDMKGFDEKSFSEALEFKISTVSDSRPTKMKDFAPLAFFELKKGFIVDPFEFMCSWSKCSPCTRGFVCADMRFIAREVREKDARAILKMLPTYVELVKGGKCKYIIKIFGVMQLTPHQSKSHWLLIEENLHFHPELSFRKEHVFKPSCYGDARVKIPDAENVVSEIKHAVKFLTNQGLDDFELAIASFGKSASKRNSLLNSASSKRKSLLTSNGLASLTSIIIFVEKPKKISNMVARCEPPPHFTRPSKGILKKGLAAPDDLQRLKLSKGLQKENVLSRSTPAEAGMHSVSEPELDNQPFIIRVDLTESTVDVDDDDAIDFTRPRYAYKTPGSDSEPGAWLRKLINKKNPENSPDKPRKHFPRYNSNRSLKDILKNPPTTSSLHVHIPPEWTEGSVMGDEDAILRVTITSLSMRERKRAASGLFAKKKSKKFDTFSDSFIKMVESLFNSEV
mmetsp:Transcript_44247/g.111477  ORF Transcript_44247/g.111477 Transcript_44247/m.111477 type:complete len:596 (-) Transcript_44247:113-1900(-)